MRSRLQGPKGEVQPPNGGAGQGNNDAQPAAPLGEAEELREVQAGGAWRVVWRDAGGLWRAYRYRGTGWGAPTPQDAATDPAARAYGSRRAARRAGQLAAGVVPVDYEATATHATLGRVVRQISARTERHAMRRASVEFAGLVDGWTWRLWRCEGGRAVELVAERTGGARHWRRPGGAS